MSFSLEFDEIGITTPNGKNRTPSSKFRGAISKRIQRMRRKRGGRKKCIRLTSCRQKGALMKFYDAALAQGVHDKVLTYDFFRFVSRAEKGLRETIERLKPLFTKKPTVENPPEIPEKIQWVQPKLVCEVAFAEWTGDGQLRQTTFLGWRDDKKPKEVLL
jgi:hypothetical protein